MGYEGESVMVSFQVRHAFEIYEKIAERLALPAEAEWARSERSRLDASIQKAAWDGEWFLWAIGADGHRYGSNQETEGKIYINTQIWAVICGPPRPISHGPHARPQARPGDALWHHAERATVHNTPSTVMVGVIFNHGIKENAGIFCHTQSWAVIAECLLGNGDQAYEYYRAFMPSAYNTRAELREIEPYVHCQTTYATCNRNAGNPRRRG